MASNMLRIAALRVLTRRTFGVTSASRGLGPAITGDPNINENFYESMITPLPPKPRLNCTTPELKALKEKEKADWKNLTPEDMKQLYNAFFGMTVADMERKDDLWKSIVGVVLTMCGLALFIHLFIHTFINPPYPSTVVDQEHINASIKRMLQQHQGDVTGYSSKWDYENNRWK